MKKASLFRFIMQAKPLSIHHESQGGGLLADEISLTMLREWKKQIEPQKRLSLAEMAAESETTLDVEARRRRH